jgi:hypothetical protein
MTNPMKKMEEILLNFQDEERMEVRGGDIEKATKHILSLFNEIVDEELSSIELELTGIAKEDLTKAESNILRKLQQFKSNLKKVWG